MSRQLQLQKQIRTAYSQAEADLAALLIGAKSGNLIPYEYGSHQSMTLWNAITHSQDYYLTKAEINLSETLKGKLGSYSSLVDLGPGSNENALAKALPLIDTIKAEAYYPVDISPEFAMRAAQAIRSKRPTLQTSPIIGNWEEDALKNIPSNALVYYSGASVGNMPIMRGETYSIALLRHLRFLKETLRDAHLLVTVDINQNKRSLENCYNAPLMRWFNHSLWQSLHDDYAVEGLEPHHISVSSQWQDGAVCHTAVAEKDMQLILNGQEFIWHKGRSVIQSHSFKPTQDEFIHLAQQAGWVVTRTFEQGHNPLIMVLLS